MNICVILIECSSHPNGTSAFVLWEAAVPAVVHVAQGYLVCFVFSLC